MEMLFVRGDGVILVRFRASVLFLSPIYLLRSLRPREHDKVRSENLRSLREKTADIICGCANEYETSLE